MIEDVVWCVNDFLSQYYFNGDKQAIEWVEVNFGFIIYQGNISVNILDGENWDSLIVWAVINMIW